MVQLVRSRSYVFGLVLVLALTLGLGFQQLLAARGSASEAEPPAATAQAAASMTDPAAQASIEPAQCENAAADEVPLEAAAPGGGKGCKDCPKTIGLKCRRVSCSPCCYECPDSEFPLCTE